MYAMNDSTKALYNVANRQTVFYKNLHNIKIQIDTCKSYQCCC